MRQHLGWLVRASGFAALLMLGAPAALAQTTSSSRAWEIEGYGGFTWAQKPGDGDARLPPPGQPIATTSPVFPSRQVPSWFFGDGATLLNGVLTEFDLPARLQPLDAAIGAVGINAGSSGAFGVRLRRGFTPTYAVEFSVDILTGSSGISDALVAAVEDTRASFEDAFQTLLPSSLFTNVDVDARSARTGGSNREIAITAALVQRFRPGSRFAPYATAGAGLTRGIGDLPTIELDGTYRFLIAGEVPIEELDRVRIRFDQRTSVIGVFGGGLRGELGERWGIRLDGRVFLGRHNTSVLIDANPSVTTGTPADFIESFTNPAIQFSNNPSTGRQSTLGPPGLDGFETFEAEGFKMRVLVTAGIFFKF